MGSIWYAASARSPWWNQEGLLTHKVGRGRTDQVASDQLLDRSAGIAPLAFGTELVNRTQVEDLSHHRSAPEECALGVVQLIQTGGQQSLDRRRDRNPLEIRRRDPAIALAPDHPIVDQHRNRLLREQRVALGGVDDPRTRGVVDASDQVLHEPLGFLGRQGLQRDRGRVELPAAPVRPEVQQIRPRHADHQDRRVPAPVGDLIHEVEQAGLSPLQVVQHDDQRLRTGQALQEPADGPSDLLRGERQPRLPADELRDPRRDLRG